MANYSVKDFFNKTSFKKIDQKTTEVTIRATEVDTNQISVNAQSYKSAGSCELSYSKFKKPVSIYDTLGSCHTSGTLFVKFDGTDDGKIKFAFFGNSKNWVGALITTYIDLSKLESVSDTAKLKFTVSNASDTEVLGTDEMTIADIKSKLPKNGDYYAYTLDMAKAYQTGELDGLGLVLTVQLDTEGTIGLSSLALYESPEALMTEDVVKVSCLSSVASTIAAQIMESNCIASGYDKSQENNPEYTMTCKTFTPNVWKLNPYMRYGEATQTSMNVTETKVVDENGQIAVAGADLELGGYIAAQIDDSCAISNSLLKRTFANIDLEDDEFRTKVDGENLVFICSKVRAGVTVKISYNKLVPVIEDTVYDDTYLDKRAYSIQLPRELEDGTKYRVTANRVYFTSFPNDINSEDSELSFSFVCMPDSNGYRYRVQKLEA